jgi:hypothetical protein
LQLRSEIHSRLTLVQKGSVTFLNCTLSCSCCKDTPGCEMAGIEHAFMIQGGTKRYKLPLKPPQEITRGDELV